MGARMRPGAARALLVLGCGVLGIILYGIWWPLHALSERLDAAMGAVLKYAERITGQIL